MDGHAAAAHSIATTKCRAAAAHTASAATGAHTAAEAAATATHAHAAATAAASTTAAATAATIAFLREGGRCREGQCAGKGDGCDCLFEHCASPDPIRPYRFNAVAGVSAQASATFSCDQNADGHRRR
jgi:hypothetical protein